MGLKVRSAAASAKRFVQRASAASTDYVEGVKNSGDEWERNTLAGKGNWQAGVTQAAARDAFGKGVSASGGKYYQERAAQLGGARFASGVAASEANYVEGVAPYTAAIANADLGPRGPRGSPENLQRAAKMAQILNAVRTRTQA